MGGNSISINQAASFAWHTYKRRYALFTASLLTIFAAWTILEIVVIAGQRFGIFLWGVAHLAFLLFVAGIEVGFLKVCLALYDGEEPTFSDTFMYMSLGPRFLAGQILYLLVTVVGIVLLVIPGIYLGIRYALFGFCLVADEATLLDSWHQSAILSTGIKTRLLAILVTLLVFNVLGASLLGFGLFVTIPLSSLIMIAVYRQLIYR